MAKAAGNLDAGRERSGGIDRVPLRSLAVDRALDARGGDEIVKRRFVENVWRDPGKLTTKLDTLGRPMHWPLIERLYANSLRSYRVRPLDCRGVLFRADRSEDCPTVNVDYSLGWTGLFGKGLEIVQVTGDHITMMREHPHDRNLARDMSDALERHCAKPQHATESPATAVSSVCATYPRLIASTRATCSASRPVPSLI